MERVLRIFVLVLFAATSATAQEPSAPQPSAPGVDADYYAPDPVLRQYVDTALGANPAIQEAFARSRAAERRVPQVTALPDPMLSFGQAIQRPETRVGSQLNTLTVSQVFPWFGKLDLRGKVAVQEAVATQELSVARQRDVIAAVKRAYYELGLIPVSSARTDPALSEECRRLGVRLN